MKRNTLVLLIAIAMISCKKNEVKVIPKHESFALEQSLVIFKPVTQSSIITYSDKTTFLVNRTTSGNSSTIIMADTAGKVVYLAYNVNDITGAISEIVTPNNPFPANESWSSCMKKAIKSCISNPLCGGSAGTCGREAIVGCLAGWGLSCWLGLLPGAQIPTFKIKKLDKAHIINNLPPIVYI